MSAAPLIATQNLTRTYSMGSTRLAALRDVTVEIQAGEFVALMGASGSGKSTLLHLLGCLDTPTGGEYWLSGQAVSGLSANARARLRNQAIGFVFQSFNLLPRLTALENVALPLWYRAASHNAAARAQAMLKRVGLGHRAQHKPNELSGGEHQRVAIARALVGQPHLLLADEPTGNLDSTSGEEIFGLLMELNAEGRTLILVTHDPALGQRAPRRLYLRDGQLVTDVSH